MEGEKRGVEVGQRAVVRDGDGVDAYELTLENGEVAIRSLRFSWSPVRVPLANLREAVSALHAMGREG
jgi:hypothetical protein